MNFRPDRRLSQMFETTSYNIFIAIMAVISIALTITEVFCPPIDHNLPFLIVNDSILMLFTLDYFIRLAIAPKKWYFFKNNIFDLIAIIPFNTAFSLFRFARLFRIARFLRLVKLIRIVGFSGRFSKSLRKILSTNGFGYVLLTSGTLIGVSTLIYSYSENSSIGRSLWWAITTTTTVGYGDVSPQTTLGRITAVVLMITGIGLIGSLTSTVTTFFFEDHNDKQNEEIADLKKQNEQILHKLDELQTALKEYKS
ncbi:ion transporter [Lentilactobacillus kosonis]|uniref:Potassium voltage-gated channel subfamily KQT n=1 Tax=Lentilactobacillus kosonis TaxID=2810561 RepID=A0A401FNA5_9LACO|nr:ion transporter [Lentilactobacillus kosonis]GAY73844.1 potassium voltage-gated channel subfamily KQT [Lentilactobacillus kosonis]